MRVLVLITRGEPGGAQVHVHALLKALRDRIDFTVGLGESGYLADALRDLGIEVHVLRTLRRAVGTQDAKALSDFRDLIRAHQPHLVHTHSTKAGLLGRLAARLHGVPSLHTAHAWSFSDGQPTRRVLAAVPPEVLVGCITTRFIVVSDADRAIARRYHVARADRIRVVHNGVEDHPARAEPDAPGTPTIVMVARMAAPKDHALLLRALARIHEPWRLQLIGDGPDREALEALIDELELGDRVDLLGTRDDVPAVLAAAHVATLVSRQEGFPLVVLEAMRAGLPVVASDVGGVREAVTADTGALVRRGDEAGLAAAFERLLTDPERRARQGRAARQSYEARFTARRMVDQTAAVYDELAREHQLPRPAPLRGQA